MGRNDVKSIDDQLLIETLHRWVRRAKGDTGQRAGPTSDDLARRKVLKQENRELRHANEMAFQMSSAILSWWLAASLS